MLDPKRLREDPKKVAEQLATRGFVFDVEQWTRLEGARKQLQVETEKLQNERNVHSKKIGQLKAKGESAEETLALVAALGEKLDVVQKKLTDIKTTLSNITQQMPNIPHHTTPIGRNEQENVEVRKWQEPKVFGFTPKDHVALGEKYLDFEAAARLSGARFVVLKGPLARLQRALAQFMLDLHTKEHGYEEVYVPYLVSSNTLYGTGQLPKAADDMFAVKDTDFWLIPTSEVAVTNLVSDQILEPTQLPLKYVCHSPCFRKEAGTYGKDMRGMLRQHQFEKVELVQVVLPEQSEAALESMVGHAEKVLQALNLPYRVVALCTGDISFQSVKTYDLEVFLPGQNQYREISSCSNTEAFQARRMQARFRDPKTDKTEFVHTLNGSGIAVGRTLIAVMENYQDEAGRIHIPEVLWPYMGGLKVI